RYERGVPLASIESGEKTNRRGTNVTFKADAEIFSVSEMNYETLSQRLRELAFLNSGVTISITDERSEKQHEFKYEGGIVSFVRDINKNKMPIHEEPILIRDEKDGEMVEIALQWNEGYTENVYAFTNTIKNSDGGTQSSRADATEGRPRLGFASRKARRLSGARSEMVRDLPRRGRLGRWIGEAGSRPALPGDSSAQGQDPQRRESAPRQDAVLRRNPADDHRARCRHWHRRLRSHEAALPQGHHH